MCARKDDGPTVSPKAKAAMMRVMRSMTFSTVAEGAM